LAAVGATLDSSTKPPGVIIHHKAKNRLLLIEPVIETGPLDENRRKELQELFAGSDAHIIFVTAFETRRTMQTFASEIAWESEVVRELTRLNDPALLDQDSFNERYRTSTSRNSCSSVRHSRNAKSTVSLTYLYEPQRIHH